LAEPLSEETNMSEIRKDWRDFMKASEIEKYVTGLFDEEKIAAEGESGFHVDDSREIKRIGYATNLTPETVKDAVEKGADLIITHHDAWDFIYGMKDYCYDILNKHGISHFFIHAPLDDADFGTNVAFMNRLGIVNLEKATLLDGRFYCGRIGELPEPMEFEALVSKVEDILGEKVKSWKNNDRMVRKVGFVSGGGMMTDYIREHADKGCDAFITGEKTLYTVQYSEFAKISLIVGSHTFTEIFGVQSLCEKIKEKYGEIEIIKLSEEHKE